MDPIASFSGLASGVQWRDLVDQIMQVERRPAALLEQQITTVQTRSAAWLSFQNKLTTFQDAAEKLADGSAFERYSTATSGSGFNATASSDAAPGSYSVEVLNLASAEKLGGNIVASSTDALGQSGEFWINGSRIELAATDSLADLAYNINAANTGAGATRVSAAVVHAGGGYQLILTSQQTGAEGIDLVDGYPGPLDFLGFTDGTSSIKQATSDGALGDAFASRTTAVSTLRGMTGTTTGRVTLGSGLQVDIDLGTGLSGIADAINTAASGAGSNISASVVEETVDGATSYRLDISGTTSFTDANGVLQALGVLEGGRSAVAQTITATNALTASAGGAAVGGTALTDLAAGARVGDTLTVSGTRGDGTTFSLALQVTDGVTAADAGYTGVATVDDLLAALNGASGFDGAATASIDGSGRLVVSDGTAGASQLGLTIVANNEGGGTLDFGTFDTSTVGRERAIVDGQDAAVRIDGVYTTRSSNSVSDAIPGVSLSLTGTSAGTPGTVTISRNTDSVVGAVKDLVDGYNEVAAFVTDQFTGGEGSTKPLQGDSSLRTMRRELLEAMQATLSTGVTGDQNRLGDLGIEITKDGTFSFDQTAFRAVLETDPTAVERLFGVYGGVEGTGLQYVNASDGTVAGTYSVDVTAPATTATLTGAANLADGTYDGPDDTLTITDLGSGSTYQVSLTAGETSAGLLADIQAELATPLAHEITTGNALYADATATAPVSASTTWDQVFSAGGVSAAVANGDTITISGRRADATSFYETYTINDTTTDTLGGLRDAIQNAVGDDATVTLDAGGRFVVTAGDTGPSLLEVTLAPDNAGGGTLDFGANGISEGRAAARIDASISGGALTLTHQEFGSAAGFRIEYTDPATETELGLGGTTATEYKGTDVVGTIGGMAATGSGQVLTGGDGTDADGLMVKVGDGFTTGSVTFSRGIGSLVQQTLDALLGSDSGSIQSILDGLDTKVTSLNDRIDTMDARLDRRRSDLIRRFTAMEQAMATAQNQSQWLASQVGSLPGSYSSNAQ